MAMTGRSPYTLLRIARPGRAWVTTEHMEFAR